MKDALAVSESGSNEGPASAGPSLCPDICGPGDGLALVGATWLPPPETGIFRARYRSGGEEGSPGLDLLIDMLAGRILDSVPR